MTEFELEVMKELSAIKTAAELAASTSLALETRLFDPYTGWITVIKEENKACAIQRADVHTRLSVMEDKHKYDDLKDYIHYGSAPLVIAIHATLRYFGINI